MVRKKEPVLVLPVRHFGAKIRRENDSGRGEGANFAITTNAGDNGQDARYCHHRATGRRKITKGYLLQLSI